MSKTKNTPSIKKPGTAPVEEGWMRLDNAAKIYPAVTNSKWTPMFRISATFREPVDVEVLQSAAEVTLKRFPGIAVSLRRGVFWNFLDPIREPPLVVPEGAYPCAPMPLRDLRKCAVRILYYDCRIAVEFFHSLTDGTGGLIFTKTLAAEYLTQKYGLDIPCEQGVFDRREPVPACELEDSFLVNEGCFSDGSRDPVSYRPHGVKEPDGYLHITTGILDSEQVLEKAHGYGVSVTTLLTAVLLKAIMDEQSGHVHKRSHMKNVAVQVPVNLRPYFGSKTMRNFALFVTPGIDPRKGEWQFEEILQSVHHQLGMYLTSKQLGAKFTSNVRSEKAMILKIMPLFIKQLALKFSFHYFGESTFATSLSNLGVVKLPEIMYDYIDRMEFVLGPQHTNTSNWSADSYGGKLYITSVRNVREADLERRFFRAMRKLGLHVLIESNQR